LKCTASDRGQQQQASPIDQFARPSPTVNGLPSFEFPVPSCAWQSR